jgi:hypothetical protein
VIRLSPEATEKLAHSQRRRSPAIYSCSNSVFCSTFFFFCDWKTTCCQMCGTDNALGVLFLE